MLVLAIVFVLVTLVPTGVSFAQAPAADGVIPDEWIVTFAAPANPNGKALGLTRAHGGQVRHVYRVALNGFSFRGPAAAAAGMARSPLVRSVVPNRAVQAVDQMLPPGVRRIDAAHPSDPLNAHGMGYRGLGVRIAILDTGIDLHPDLNVDTGLGINCVDPTEPADDGDGHGTHVAGSAAAKDNSEGVIGVAPDASLVAVKVLDDNGQGSWATVICGIEYVTDNKDLIRVANMSLSGAGSATGCNDGGLHEAICASVEKGVVYTVAAGNDDTDAANRVPAAYGDDAGVITVSAMADYDGEPGRNGGCLRFSGLGRQCDDTFAKFSNWGSKVDVVAPGVQVYSTNRGNSYSYKTGTSMAAPHVAGVAALMRAANPDLTPAQVETLLKEYGECPNGQQNNGTGACSDQGTWKNDPDGTPEPLVNAFRAAEAADGAGGGGDDPNPPTAENVNSDNVMEDSPVGVEVTLSGSDVEVCELIFAIVSPPADGSLSVITDASCATGSPNTDTALVTYTPNADFFGNDSFTYSVNDGTMTSLSATVTVPVDAVNDPPVADAGPDQDVQTGSAVDLDGSGSEDIDDSPSYSWAFVSKPTGSNATLSDASAESPSFTADFDGDYQLELTVGDGEFSDVASVTITATPAPDPGSAISVHVATLSGSSINNGKTWKAEVIVKVENDLNIAEEGVEVSGTWTGTGGTKKPICTTDGSGFCTVSFDGIRKRNGSVTFTVDNLKDASPDALPYDQVDNVVSSTVVNKP